MVLSLCLACVDVEILFSNKLDKDSQGYSFEIPLYMLNKNLSVFKFPHVQPWL